MGTGRPGGLRRLRAQALLADGRCQGFGGDRVSAASSCPKPLLLFSRGTQLPSLCRARAVGDPEEIGGSSQQGRSGGVKPPSLTYTCSRSSEIWGLVWETVRTSERSPPSLCGASGFESALRRADMFDLQQGLARPEGLNGLCRQYLHSAQKGKPVVCGDLLRE